VPSSRTYIFADRVAEHTAFMRFGEFVELAMTEEIFLNSTQRATEDYVTGRFGRLCQVVDYGK
jgi:ABC-type phosphate transport system ATPase subunit